MNQFVFADCTTESGALAQLSQNAKDGIVVKAGGVDLLDRMKEGLEIADQAGEYPQHLLVARHSRNAGGPAHRSADHADGNQRTPADPVALHNFCRFLRQCGHSAHPQHGNAGRKSAAGKSLLVFSFERLSMPAQGKRNLLRVWRAEPISLDHGLRQLSSRRAVLGGCGPAGLNAKVELTSAKRGKRVVGIKELYVHAGCEPDKVQRGRAG